MTSAGRETSARFELLVLHDDAGAANMPTALHKELPDVRLVSCITQTDYNKSAKRREATPLS